ncbi:MAG: Hsp33 family molecular chaperone HslO [Desulfobacterales bacterium]|nr:Hsp33 family molecular chaperone HslO [Desulfobacterales bacterium]MCP4160237.1 Hsp33 family molecular chaperone HslO [Deltaproteobacteria bacterium]
MEKKKLFGNDLKQQLLASKNDRLYNYIMDDGHIRCAIVNCTRMVNEMRSNFDLGILETLIAGQAYIAASLLTANLKGNDRVAVKIECSGPLKGLTVESNSFGEVRGFLKNQAIELDKPLESFNLSKFFGAGFISVTKYLEDAKQPYTGQIMLEYGDIANDIANYFHKSEQTPTAFNLSVSFDKDGNVKGAGGLFIQAMPGADEQSIIKLEDKINNFPSIGKFYEENQDPDILISKEFKSLKPKQLGDYRVEFFCRCDDKKIGGMVEMLPIDELKDIAENGPFPLEIKCHNCNTSYTYDKEQIEDLYNKRTN